MPVLVMSPNGAVTRKATIAAAVAAGDIAKKILIVTTDQTINDVTIPATVELQILNGAVITVNSGKTLTISGEFQKPSYACFAGAGTVVIPAGGPGATQDYSVKALTVAGLTTLGAALNEKQGNDIVSATTTDIGAATGNYVKITGTTTITALGTVQAGTRRIIEFTGILTLTHNATSLILPTGANITTAAGDVATFISEGSGNWRCVGYLRANGVSLNLLVGAIITSPTGANVAAAGNYTIPFTAENLDTHTLHDNVTNSERLTIPAGLSVSYGNFTAVMTLKYAGTTGSTGSWSYVLYKNGSSTLRGVGGDWSQIVPSTAGGSGTVTMLLPMIAVAAGDYFDLRFFNNTNQSISIVGGHFCVELR